MVGVKQIDEQHKKLIEIIHMFSDAIKANKSNDVLGKSLQDLIDYTISHFSAEESLMLTYAYPEYGAHAKEHEDLRQTVADLQEKFRERKSTVSIEIIYLLSDWLRHHILEVDNHLATFLKKQGMK